MGRKNVRDESDISDDFDVRKAGAGYSAFAWLVALAWIGAVGAGIYAAYGVDQLLAAPPVAKGAIGGIAVVPALLIIFCGMALREGARGRAQARALADAAERMLHPSPTAEAEARRLGVSVRGEIAALDRALDQTLQKVREVEAVIARQTMAVDSAAAMAQSGARSIIGGLERERAELLQIGDDLNEQANSIGQAISRHTRLIADAARLAEAEVRAADEALDSRLSSFGAAAALISDRTTALTKAAQASAESALRLENALSTALDSLAQATALTDAAKKSAESATFAANSTAGAVRDTTLRAVEDAKRAAELIRAEAAAVERAGMEAIQRLRDVAGEARSGFAAAPAAAEERRRIDPVARAADPARTETFAQPRAEMAPRPPARSAPERPDAARAEPPRPDPGRQAPGRPDLTRPDPDQPSQTPAGRDARWTWKDVIAAVDDPRTSDPVRARGPGAEPPAGGRGRAPVQSFEGEDGSGRSDPQRGTPRRDGWGFTMRGGAPGRTQLDPAYDRFRAADPPEDEPTPPLSQSAEGALIAAAGVSLHEVFSPHALERIGQRAKNGTQARRRAVREAAQDAVTMLAEYLDESAEARTRAAAFLRAEGARISELLGRGRASLGSETTRAFLLLDAASA